MRASEGKGGVERVRFVSKPSSTRSCASFVVRIFRIPKILTMIKFDCFFEESKSNLPPEEYYPDGRFNHNQQIHERLNFLK